MTYNIVTPNVFWLHDISVEIANFLLKSWTYFCNKATVPTGWSWKLYHLPITCLWAI